jgi:hypothetical protein
MLRIKLGPRPPYPSADDAREFIAAAYRYGGLGTTADLELLRAIAEELVLSGEEAEFFREEPSGRVVTITPEQMLIAYERGIEMRPSPTQEVPDGPQQQPGPLPEDQPPAVPG